MGGLSNWRRRRWQRERQSSRFRQAKEQLCTCITLFFTLLCRHCTTMTWNFLISRFVEDVNTRQRYSFSPSFYELRYNHLESTSKKSPNFDKLNELELERWSLKQRESFYFGGGRRFSYRCLRRCLSFPCRRRSNSPLRQRSLPQSHCKGN